MLGAQNPFCTAISCAPAPVVALPRVMRTRTRSGDPSRRALAAGMRTWKCTRSPRCAAAPRRTLSVTVMLLLALVSLALRVARRGAPGVSLAVRAWPA